jgi:hypothetical protein
MKLRMPALVSCIAVAPTFAVGTFRIGGTGGSVPAVRGRRFGPGRQGRSGLTLRNGRP